ncbi:MAG: hypothetical protein ACRC9Z_10330 [Weissella confusa]
MNYGAGATGVADVHYGFAKPKKFDVEQERRNILMNASKTHTQDRFANKAGETSHSKYELRYERFEKLRSQGMTLRQVADAMGMSMSAVSSERYAGRYNKENA